MNLSRHYVGVPSEAAAEAAVAAFAELQASGGAAALEGGVGAGNGTALAEGNTIIDLRHLARLLAGWRGDRRLLLGEVAAGNGGSGMMVFSWAV